MAQEVFWMAVVSSAQLKVTRREYYAQPSTSACRVAGTSAFPHRSAPHVTSSVVANLRQRS
jgi:hypothetical protein